MEEKQQSKTLACGATSDNKVNQGNSKAASINTKGKGRKGGREGGRKGGREEGREKRKKERKKERKERKRKLLPSKMKSSEVSQLLPRHDKYSQWKLLLTPLSE